ncbi:beta-lactamase family protein [Sphingopyxis indica]|uniref:serine hydrolase domain-containing protein n=1 Tax=Sphingopyxis indica TaxID=436663 RepID=UPI0029393A25|nr:serine hydrolase domain-containing protein [Sphingopyxis indica]WOF44419.1 beta-lactamase family protein [Sphingopyxis indica]
MKWWKTLAVGVLTLVGGASAAQQATAPGPSLSPVADAAPVAAPAAATTEGARALTRSDADTWLDGFMPYALARGDVAGAVVVIVKDGKVLTQRGFGYADVAKRKPVDPATTLFRPGSVSKLFTWTAVMQQVEAGKIDLDADINQYLDFRIPPFEGKPITMTNIMTHTPGFEEAGRDLIVDKGPAPTLETALKRWVPARVYAPGSTPAYSNYATALAGYVVQRVSGMSYDDYIDRNIFDRLGMKYATFRQPLPERLQPYMAKGYKAGSGKEEPFEYVAIAPAGSSSISGGDMAKFMIAHLDDGGPLLKPETAALMHSPANEPLPGLPRMMHGFYEQKINGLGAIAHGGDTMWFHSDLVLFPSKNTGIYVSMNSAGKDGAVGPIREALVQEFADRYFPAPRSVPKALPTAKQHAAMVAGTYATSRAPVDNWGAMLGFASQVKIGVDENGNLVTPFKTIGGGDRKWVEVKPFIWQSLYDKATFAAKVENGKVVRIFYGDYAPIMVWDPVPAYKDTAWLIPVVIASLAVILLTALAWPVGAINRRRYGQELALTGGDRSTYRAVRLFAWLVFVILGCWVACVTLIEKFVTPVGLIWFAQILGILVFPGFLGLTIWNAYLAFKGKRGWFARLWSVLLVLAAFFMLWTALAFKLISLGANW